MENLTKLQRQQISEACKVSWNILGKKELNYPIVRERKPGEVYVKEDNFEVEYLMACAQLGFNDQIVLTYPKWRHTWEK